MSYLLRNIALTVILLSTLFISQAKAGVYQFIPSRPDLFDLDHYMYYTWGINWTPKPNESIVSAKLEIKKINNWIIENDILYIHLLDKADLGLKTYWDNQGGGDSFLSWNSQNILVDTYTDLFDAPGPPENYSYNFSTDELAKLHSYSLDGRFGLGFDPDCHYYNDGVKFTIETTHTPEPSSLALLSSALIGAFKLRKRKNIA